MLYPQKAAFLCTIIYEHKTILIIDGQNLWSKISKKKGCRTWEDTEKILEKEPMDAGRHVIFNTTIPLEKQYIAIFMEKAIWK